MARPEFIENVEQLRSLAPVATAPIRHHVFVCTGKSCSARDSADVLEAFENDLKERGLLFGREAKGKNPGGSIVVTSCASVGFCSIGPAVMVYPDGVWYEQVRAAYGLRKRKVRKRKVRRIGTLRDSSADHAIETLSV